MPITKIEKPAFEIVPHPLRVSADLLALSDDAAVIFKTHWFDAAIKGDSTAGTLKAEIEKRIFDQSKGFFSVDEAACIVAKATTERPKDVRLQIWKAIDDGHLVPVSYKTFAPLPLPLAGGQQRLSLVTAQGLTKVFPTWPIALFPMPTPVTLGTREPASAGTTPLTMNQTANCFAGFHDWDVSQWKKSLGSPDKWLGACRSARGTRGKGGSESAWWPLEIAAALIKMDGNSERSLRARFKNSEPLKPWFEQFEINYPENTDSL